MQTLLLFVCQLLYQIYSNKTQRHSYIPIRCFSMSGLTVIVPSFLLNVIQPVNFSSHHRLDWAISVSLEKLLFTTGVRFLQAGCQVQHWVQLHEETVTGFSQLDPSIDQVTEQSWDHLNVCVSKPKKNILNIYYEALLQLVIHCLHLLWLWRDWHVLHFTK